MYPKNWTVAKFKRQDIEGKIDISDVILVLRKAVGL